MSAGEFFVSEDGNDVTVVFADFDGDDHKWTMEPTAAVDLAAELMVKAAILESEAADAVS